MSAIISDIKDDLQRLEELKRKIDEVKRELLSINGVTDKANFDRLNKELQNTTQQYRNLSSNVRSSVSEITASSLSLTKALGALGGIAALKGLVSQMISVRGEFQKADTAIQTMLGSKEKADALLSEVRQYAKISPLEFGDITRATQMMLGFNIESEKVPGFIKAIGDVSMGESGKFNSLTLAFSQMSAAGKLMGQDLNQMINAGFNPLSVMAEKTGKSIGQLKEEMSKGAITAEMVQQAFIDATSAGGKFYNMSENAAKTIEGQFSMMHDAIDSMFNELGKKSEGVIVGSIESVTKLIENYEEIGKVLLTVVAAVGTYKAALLAVMAAQKIMAIGRAAQEFIIMAKCITSAKDAMLLFNTATKLNPVGLLVSVLAAGAAAFGLFNKSAKTASQISEEFGKNAEKATTDARALMATVVNTSAASKTHKDAIGKLSSLYGEYGIQIKKLDENYSNEAEVVKDLTDKHTDLLNAIKAESIERQKANALKTISDDYQQAIDDAWERISKNIGGDNANTIAATIRIAVKDEELIKLEELREEMSKLSKEGNMDEARKSGEAYMNMLNTLESRVQSIGEKFNLSARTIRSVQRALQGTSSDIYSAKEAMVTATNVVNEGASAIEGYASSAENAAFANRLSKMSVSELQKELMNLVNNYANTTLGVHIVYDEVNVPTWMNGMDLKQTRQLAENFTKLLHDSNAKSFNFGNGKVMSRQEVAERAVQYTKASEMKTPKPTTPTVPTKPKKTPQKTGKTSSWNQAHADADAKKLIEEWGKELKETLVDVQQDIDDANIAILNESTEKTLKKLDEDEKKEINAIEKQRKDLIEKRKELDEKLWEKKTEKNDQYNFVAKSDEEYAAMIEQDQPGLLSALTNREKQIHDVYKKQRDDIAKQEAEKWREYEIQYGNYQQKRLAITEKYNALIKDTDSDVQKAIYSQQMERELDELDDKIMESSGLWSEYFGKFESRSSSAIRGVMDDIQNLIYYMSGLDGAQIPDIFKESKETVDAINEAMEDPEAKAKFIEGLRKQYKTFEKMVDANNPFKMISKGFKDGSNKDMADGFKQIADAMGTVQQVMESLGVSADSTVGKITSAIGNTANLAAQGAQIGGVWGAAAGTALGIAQGLIGAFGADYSQYQKLVEEYTGLITVWDTLIEKKKEYIEMSYGSEAAKAGQEAIDIIERQTEAYKNLGKEWLNAGASAGSHSKGVRMRKGMDAEDWNNVAKALGRTVDNYAGLGGRLEGLFDLSAEELMRLQEQAPEFWSKLDEETRKYLDDIIEGTEKIEDMQKRVNEQLTSTSFDSLKDSFASVLYDMESTASKGGENIGDALFKSIVDNFILGEEFDSWLQGFYEKWAKKIGSGGMSKSDWDEYYNEYQTKLADKIAERDAWAAAMGYTGTSSDQTATSSAAEKITYDQAEIMTGILTAIQIAVEQGNIKKDTIQEYVSVATATTQDIRSINTEIRDIASDTRDIIARSYLELVEIRDNTGAIVRPIKNIEQRVESIERKLF